MYVKLCVVAIATFGLVIAPGCKNDESAKTPAKETSASPTGTSEKPAAEKPADRPAAKPTPPPPTTQPSVPPSAASTAPRVRIATSMGDIDLELDPDKAPITVKNFLEYVDSGFHDGTIFHRVMNGFMIQAGGFEPGMKQKTPRAPIQNEAKNGLKNLRGTVAMARLPVKDPHTATSQFFINVVDNAFLNYPGRDGWGYCVFGKVIEGMDVVDKIEAVPTHTVGMHEKVPVDDVVIKSIRRL